MAAADPRAGKRRRNSAAGSEGTITRYACHRDSSTCIPDEKGAYEDLGLCQRDCRPRNLQEALPNELLASAAAFLPASELSRLQPVSRRMSAALREERERRVAVPRRVTHSGEGMPYAEHRQYVIVFAAQNGQHQAYLYGVCTMDKIHAAIGDATEHWLTEVEHDVFPVNDESEREVWLFGFEPLNELNLPPIPLPVDTCPRLVATPNDFRRWAVAVELMPIRNLVTREVTNYYFRDVTQMLHLDRRSGLRNAAHGAHMSKTDLVNALFGIGQNTEAGDTPYQTWMNRMCTTRAASDANL